MAVASGPVCERIAIVFLISVVAIVLGVNGGRKRPSFHDVITSAEENIRREPSEARCQSAHGNDSPFSNTTPHISRQAAGRAVLIAPVLASARRDAKAASVRIGEDRL